MNKMSEAMKAGQMSEIIQHPCLQNQEFLREFEKFCETKGQLRDVISAVDPQHGLPLAYWSLWSLSSVLPEWCLGQMTSQHGNNACADHLLRTALLAALVTNITDTDMSRLVKRLLEHLAPFAESTGTKELAPPLPQREERYNNTLHKVCDSMEKNLTRGSLCYLGIASLGILPEILNLKVEENVIYIKLQCPLLQHILLRLLTDNQVDERDGEGNTLLHAAAVTGQLEVVEMLVNSGASLLMKEQPCSSPAGGHAQGGGSKLHGILVDAFPSSLHWR